ncbi:MAG: hypothetical protein ACJ72O_00015 [Marmoricola sp.]
MFSDFRKAFGELFSTTRGRSEVSGMLLLMALLPVSELVVTRMFSHLILRDHPQEMYAREPHAFLRSAGIFFLAFALSRGLHHLVRLNRVRIFRRAFDASAEQRPASKEAWSWAGAFELSTAMVGLIQVAAFCGLFFWVSPIFGIANLVIVTGVMSTIAFIYRHQLTAQMTWLGSGKPPGQGEVGMRVGRRIRDAELGAVVASFAMACSLGAVLFTAAKGKVGGADAFVLFIGLRMLYSQVGNVSASAMRFARVKARLANAAVKGGLMVPDPDDEFDMDDIIEDGEEAEDPGALRPAEPTPHRTRLVAQMMAAGQRGDLELVGTFGERLSRNVVPMDSETQAMGAAEAFAHYAGAADDRQPLALMWWARPFPGAVGNWLSPLVLRGVADRALFFQRPGAETPDTHLVMIGSIASSIQKTSIVAGTGALNAEVEIEPKAEYVSVRGPLTAEALFSGGGPKVTSFGDPTLLTSRFIPLDNVQPNGRLAFVRHISHADLELHLDHAMDEFSPLASSPPAIKQLVRTLAAYDGVVTSDFSTMAVCHSYGIPVAPITFDGRDDLRFVFKDYSRGAGFETDVEPRVVGQDLRKQTWADQLVARTVEVAKLDEIQASVSHAVSLFLDQVAGV